MAFFIWLEDTAVSVWIRETPSLWGFPFILYLHTLGLALIAGLSSAVALMLLTLPERAGGGKFSRLFPYMWIGLAINALSGLALLIAYPAKAMTNPVFYIKLVAIGIAVTIVAWLERQLRPAATPDQVAQTAGAATLSSKSAPVASEVTLRRAAWSLLGLWAIATLTGRLLAYTHSVLMAGEGPIF